MLVDPRTQAMREEAAKLIALGKEGVGDPRLALMEARFSGVAIVLDDPQWRDKAPTLNELVKEAKRQAEDYSSLDSPIEKDVRIMLLAQNDKSVDAELIKKYVPGSNAILLSLREIEESTYQQLLATIAHEYSHSNGPRMEHVKAEEARADRVSDASICLDKNLFSISRWHTAGVPFAGLDSSDSHPPPRSRIEMNIRKLYGDDIFKDNVIYNADKKQWVPIEFNGMPVTEDGRAVTNWKTEILPAIEQQVAVDMQRFDHMVRDGFLTPSEHRDFMNQVLLQTEDFREKHSPTTEISNGYVAIHKPEPKYVTLYYKNANYVELARLFRESLDDANKGVGWSDVLIMHPRLANAYQAYHNVKEQAESVPGRPPEALKLIEKAAIEKIASGIAHGQFPDVKVDNLAIKEFQKTKAWEPLLQENVNESYYHFSMEK